MIAKFSHPDQAIAYVCNGLTRPVLPETVEISAVVGGGYFLSTQRVPLAQVREVLWQHCQHFPEATALVGETEEGHTYAAVQCSCDAATRKECPHHCEHSASRPLMLVLTLPGCTVSRRRILDAIAREVHDDLKAERHRSDAAENTHVTRHGHEHRERGEARFRDWLDRG